MIWVNAYNTSPAEVPFGGFKMVRVVRPAAAKIHGKRCRAVLARSAVWKPSITTRASSQSTSASRPFLICRQPGGCSAVCLLALYIASLSTSHVHTCTINPQQPRICEALCRTRSLSTRAVWAGSTCTQPRRASNRSPGDSAKWSCPCHPPTTWCAYASASQSATVSGPPQAC
jgi:hypothetical protein